MPGSPSREGFRVERRRSSSSDSRTRSPPKPRTRRSRSRTAGRSRSPRHGHRAGSSAETHGKTRRKSRSRTRDRSRSPRHRRRSVSSNRPIHATPIKTRHGDSSTSDSSEEETSEDRKGLSRRKKMKAVDTTDPFSTIKRQISNKKNHEVPSAFAKKTWWEMRGMDASGKFVPEDESKHDEWKQKAKSDRLVRKYSGEAFADTKLDDGLHSIVDKTESQEEKDLIKMQRVMGAMGHLTLKAMEGYSTVYKKLMEFVNAGLGSPELKNPAYQGEQDQINHEYIWSDRQEKSYKDFQDILTELQVDVADHLASVSRIAASSFTKVLDKRREKVLAKIKKNNPMAASTISKLPPSANSLFGGDHDKLERVVKLSGHLNYGKKSHQGGQSGGSSYKSKHSGGGGAGNEGHGSDRGGGNGVGGGRGKGGKSSGGRGGRSFRGGTSYRGGKKN